MKIKMKKMNSKGFTLIELLAVITIMGILMMVAIPAVSRTIENARRDTFADVAHEYLNTVRNNVLADQVACNTAASGTAKWEQVSALPNGSYYFPICTSSTANGCAGGTGLDTASIQQSTLDLMESGGKSSFGNSHVVGYVAWVKSDSGTVYTVKLADVANHGMTAAVAEEEIKRSNVKVSGVTPSSAAPSGHKPCKLYD